MVEEANIRTIFDNVDTNRALYRTLLAEHFGHLEPNALAEAMKVIKDAYKDGENVTVNQLHEQLADKMLVVGGRNSVANEQLSIVTMAYSIDQAAWDTVVALYEKEQRAKNG